MNIYALNYSRWLLLGPFNIFSAEKWMVLTCNTKHITNPTVQFSCSNRWFSHATPNIAQTLQFSSVQFSFFTALGGSELLRGCGEGCCWCQAAQGKRHPVQASMQCLFGLHGCSLAAFDLAQCRGYFNATMTISCRIDAAFCPCSWFAQAAC